MTGSQSYSRSARALDTVVEATVVAGEPLAVSEPQTTSNDETGVECLLDRVLAPVTVDRQDVPETAG